MKSELLEKLRQFFIFYLLTFDLMMVLSAVTITMFSSSANIDCIEILITSESVDASNAVQLKTLLKKLDLQGKDRLVVNLKEVEFIDSSGIGVLLSLYKQHNQKVSLKQPSPSVLSVLELLRLHRIFEIEFE